MYCGYCGSQLKEALPFCPYCGNKLSDTRIEPRPQPRTDSRTESRAEPPVRPRPEPRAAVRVHERTDASDTRGSIPVPQFAQRSRRPVQQQRPLRTRARAKKRAFLKNPGTNTILIAATAVFLVIAIILGVIFCLPGNSSGGSTPFSKAAKSAPKNSSNREVLTVLSAAYQTVFKANSFKMDLRYDEEILLHLETQFGKDLVSCGAYGYYQDEDTSFALSKGTLAVQDYGDGLLFDVDAIAPDLDRVADYFGQKIGDIESGDIQSMMNDLYGSKNEIISNALHVVKRNRLNINALNTLVSLAGNALNKQYDANVPITSLDSAFEIAGDFLAKMPEDLIRIDDSKPSGGNREYAYSFNAIDVAEAFIRYVESDASLQALVNLFLSADMQEDFKNEVALEKQNYYADYGVSGSVVFSSNILQSVTVRTKNTTVQINLSDVNETKVSSSKLAEVKNQFTGEAVSVGSADDLIRLISGEIA